MKSTYHQFLSTDLHCHIWASFSPRRLHRGIVWKAQLIFFLCSLVVVLVPVARRLPCIFELDIYCEPTHFSVCDNKRYFCVCFMFWKRQRVKRGKTKGKWRMCGWLHPASFTETLVLEPMHIQEEKERTRWCTDSFTILLDSLQYFWTRNVFVDGWQIMNSAK